MTPYFIFLFALGLHCDSHESSIYGSKYDFLSPFNLKVSIKIVSMLTIE